MENYYDLLKVKPNSTIKEIKDSFKNLIKQHHPDITLKDSKKAKQLIEAYKVLSNKELRKIYDDSINIDTTIDYSYIQDIIKLYKKSRLNNTLKDEYMERIIINYLYKKDIS